MAISGACLVPARALPRRGKLPWRSTFLLCHPSCRFVLHVLQVHHPKAEISSLARAHARARLANTSTQFLIFGGGDETRSLPNSPRPDHAFGPNHLSFIAIPAWSAISTPVVMTLHGVLSRGALDERDELETACAAGSATLRSTSPTHPAQHASVRRGATRPQGRGPSRRYRSRHRRRGRRGASALPSRYTTTRDTTGWGTC